MPHSMTADDPIPTERNRADDLMKSGRPAEAAPIYRKLADERLDEDSHLFALAWALHDSGQLEEAAACFERLFRKELGRKLFTGFAYDELVRIYREGKNGEALVSVCERAAEAQPEDIGLRRTLGEAYLAAGKGAEAVPVFERLAGIEPVYFAVSPASPIGQKLTGLKAGDSFSLNGKTFNVLEVF